MLPSNFISVHINTLFLQTLMKTDTIILVLYFATTGHVAISPVITSIYHCQTGGRTGIYQDPAK